MVLSLIYLLCSTLTAILGTLERESLPDDIWHHILGYSSSRYTFWLYVRDERCTEMSTVLLRLARKLKLTTKQQVLDYIWTYNRLEIELACRSANASHQVTSLLAANLHASVFWGSLPRYWRQHQDFTRLFVPGPRYKVECDASEDIDVCLFSLRSFPDR